MSVPPPAAASMPGFGESPASVAHWVLPVGRPWQSLAAGYIAIFALLLWPLGVVALGLGVWALVRSSRDGSHGRGRAIFAIVIGALMPILFLVIFLHALIG